MKYIYCYNIAAQVSGKAHLKTALECNKKM